MRRRFLKILTDIIILVLLGGGIVYATTWYAFQRERQDVEFGVNFSTVMARQLKLKPREVFDAIIDDLGAKKVRLPVYWSDVEPERGRYNFADYDYFVRRAEDEGVNLILAIGRKLPRWPECFIPKWAEAEFFLEGGEGQTLENLVFSYISEVIARYRNSSAVKMWQVENEPFFRFGAKCAERNIPEEVVRREVELIKSLDSRPVMVTDSGEQGLWYKAARNGDILGITMYRQAWNPVFKVVRFPFGPGFYAIKWSLLRGLASYYEAKPRSQKIVVIELQTEPWAEKLLPDYDVNIQKKLMSVEQFRENISFARKSGFDTFYVWGAEWWYWLKKTKEDHGLWEEAKLLFR